MKLVNSFEMSISHMEIAKIPTNEKERLSSLLSFNILDTDFEKEYDELVNLASYICDTSIALIS